ncbi:MAG: calcium-binding protein, partial [Pirellulaceae bacterium]|nr:calcium-binding protein [Pirellulaceae bacterium]
YSHTGGDATAGEFTAETLLGGSEMHGGPGGDWLYGSIRKDVIYGDTGADFMHGDWLFTNLYAINNNADTLGGDDYLNGGSGEEQILGGGGNDEIWGGADSDWLEGQDGNDTLYGGSWIDIIVLDTRQNYSYFGDVFDGHYGNTFAGDVLDDNATDILLVEGSDLNDTILLAEEVALLGSVEIPDNGMLSGTADFTINLEGADVDVSSMMSVAVGIGIDSTVSQLNQAIQDRKDGLGNNIFMRQLSDGTSEPVIEVVRRGRYIAFVTRDLGRTATLTLTAVNAYTTSRLGFAEGQVAVERLVATMTTGFGTETVLNSWRNDAGEPMIEQFRISGLGGNDTI